MKPSIHNDVYLKEVHAALIRAGGGKKELVDIQEAAVACIGIGAGLIALMPRRNRRLMIDYITKNFNSLVIDAQTESIAGETK